MDSKQSLKASTWPDTFETFHIPSSLDSGYILAFKKPPTSLKNLIIENGFLMGSDGVRISADVLAEISRLIGTRIRTLKVNYDGDLADNFPNVFVNFPNLLDISVWPCFIFADAMNCKDLKTDHPLRSVAMKLDSLDNVFDPGVLGGLGCRIIAEDRLPNTKSVLVSSHSWEDQFLYFLWKYWVPKESLEKMHLELQNIVGDWPTRISLVSRELRHKRAYVNSEDNDGTIFEITNETISKILSRVLISMTASKDEHSGRGESSVIIANYDHNSGREVTSMNS
jgi:hypothetical protein